MPGWSTDCGFCIDFAGLFASKPAPTLDLCSPPTQCGSGLAREGVSPDNHYPERNDQPLCLIDAPTQHS
ncbi:hypothetical protein C1X65_04225 [Pseudomonas sp. FW305-70]|nr:hypothetical protein C1X65_04225 [Pseudomonas sp. FW305-70]